MNNTITLKEKEILQNKINNDFKNALFPESIKLLERKQAKLDKMAVV